MNGNGRSEVVAVMQEAKAAAWEAWWLHVTRARGSERYSERERELWAVYEDCADACHREIDLRAELVTAGAFA